MDISTKQWRRKIQLNGISNVHKSAILWILSNHVQTHFSIDLVVQLGINQWHMPVLKLINTHTYARFRHTISSNAASMPNVASWAYSIAIHSAYLAGPVGIMSSFEYSTASARCRHRTKNGWDVNDGCLSPTHRFCSLSGSCLPKLGQESLRRGKVTLSVWSHSLVLAIVCLLNRSWLTLTSTCPTTMRTRVHTHTHTYAHTHTHAHTRTRTHTPCISNHEWSPRPL